MPTIEVFNCITFISNDQSPRLLQRHNVIAIDVLSIYISTAYVIYQFATIFNLVSIYFMTVITDTLIYHIHYSVITDSLIYHIYILKCQNRPFLLQVLYHFNVLYTIYQNSNSV